MKDLIESLKSVNQYLTFLADKHYLLFPALLLAIIMIGIYIYNYKKYGEYEANSSIGNWKSWILPAIISIVISQIYYFYSFSHPAKVSDEEEIF